MAQDNWTNPSGGNFSDGSNWSLGHPPTIFGDTYFNLPDKYTVTLAAPAMIGSLLSTEGDVTLDLGAKTLNSGLLDLGSNPAGPGAVLSVTNGTISPSYVVVNTDGVLNVLAGGTIDASSGGTMTLNENDGTKTSLNIAGGGESRSNSSTS